MIGKIDFSNWVNDGEPTNTAVGSFYDTVLNNLEDFSKGDSSKLDNPFEAKRLSRERNKNKEIQEVKEERAPFGAGIIIEEINPQENKLSEEEYKERATAIANSLFGKGVVEVNVPEKEHNDNIITDYDQALEEFNGDAVALHTIEEEDITDSSIIDKLYPVEEELPHVEEELPHVEEELTVTTCEPLSEDALVKVIADVILETANIKQVSAKIEILKNENVKEVLIKSIESIPNEVEYENTNSILLEFLRRKPSITQEQLDGFTLLYNKIKPYNKLRHRVDDNIKINKYLKAMKIAIAMKV